MDKKIEVVSNKSSLISKALDLVINKIKIAIETRNICRIALSGGSTPKPLYEAIAKQELPWSQIEVFWGDERYVSSNNSQSNQKMARESWLNLVDIPAKNIHPIPTEAGNPLIDAERYQEEIIKYIPIQDNQILPVFDIILLGMGDDGHTASLFPKTEALQVRDRLVTVGNKDGEPRITFTVPLINAARCVIFLVAGENKQPALKEIFAPTGDWSVYPSRLIEPQGELWWLLDESAGAVIQS